MSKTTLAIFLAVFLSTTMVGCGGESNSETESSTSTDTGTGTGTGGSTGGSTGGGTGSSSTISAIDLKAYAEVSLGDCASDSDLKTLVCATDLFIKTLTTDQLEALVYDWDDNTAKTTWSNLPTDNVQRNGLALGTLSDASLKAAMVVAKAALSDAGYQDFLGVLAADDYLNSLGGGAGYSSGKYYLAFVGYPTVGGSWMLQLGGHHLAYNITYIGSEAHPVPHHIGVEPKAAFEVNSTSYAPLAEEGNAFAAMFTALDTSQLSTAYLSGESYADVLVGPDNGSGKYPTDYPTGSERRGILVSGLSEQQQSLVTEAIKQFVNDYPDDVAAQLLADYTSAANYADTYISWAGSQASGVNVDVGGTYMRIDGPRVWIEIACQNGVIVKDKTHYHTIFRDKSMDYGQSL